MATLLPQASVASGAPSGGSEGALPPPLVGQAGQDFVQTTLSTHDPLEAIAEIQRRGGLPDPRCAPLLCLLGALGVSRSEACRHILQTAMADLLARLPSLEPDTLLRLLEASFPFIGLAELRGVPLAILDRLHPVPAPFLKQLVADPQLFSDLPLGVQRQAWNLDRKLLQAHALPYVLGAALQRLTRMVGRGRQVYRGLVELAAVRFRDGDTLYVGVREAALCALRSQLLMALHDLGEAELCGRDPCHKLAWTLDACLMDQRLDARRLQEVANFFARFDDVAPRPSTVRRGQKRTQQAASSARGWDDGAASSGVPGASAAHDSHQELGDAGMVLRDPPSLHLIVHHILRRIAAAVEEERQPVADPDLLLLTRLLQLAVGCRAGLRQGRVVYAEASPELTTTLYPTLANLVLEAMLREDGDGIDPETETVVLDTLVPLLTRNEAVRKVVQMFLLERMAERDLPTSALLLKTMASAMEMMTDKSIPEFAPFGFSLARQVATLLAEGVIAVDDAVWQLAFDRILIKIVDSETAVHEEVLRLLLAASPSIQLLPLANYLHHTLSNSRKSRKRYKKRKLANRDAEPWSEYDSGAAYLDGYASTGYASAGKWRQGEEPETDGKGADGVKATYVLFAQKFPGLNATTAPTLHAYLEVG